MASYRRINDDRQPHDGATDESEDANHASAAIADLTRQMPAGRAAGNATDIHGCQLMRSRCLLLTAQSHRLVRRQTTCGSLPWHSCID